METILYVGVGIFVLLVIFSIISSLRKGPRRHSSDGHYGSDSWDSDSSDSGSDSGCSSGCGGGGD